MPLLDKVKINKVLGNIAASTATTNSAAIDMQNAESVLGILSIGTLTATGTIVLKAQESDASGSGYADIVGATVSNTGNTATDKSMALEVIKPRKRYVRFVVTTAVANCELESIVAIVSTPKKMETTQPATVDASLQKVAP